jgi:tetratricopeptide (TPR) repeat protein
LAGFYLTRGQYVESQQAINQALRISPSTRGYSVAGLAHYYSGHYQDAANALELAVKLDPRYYIAWGNLGSAYRRIPGAEEKAAAAFRRAVALAFERAEITPNDYGIRANLAEYFAKLGDPARALQELERIPSAKRFEHLGQLALAYELSGKRREAINLVEQAAGTQPVPPEVRDDPELVNLLADPSWKAKTR